MPATSSSSIGCTPQCQGTSLNACPGPVNQTCVLGCDDDVLTGLPACVTIRQMALGGDHTCALLSNGNVYCWGANGSGQLGVPGAVETAVPELVAMPGGEAVKQLESGIRHVCALTVGDLVYCWGDNRLAQAVPTEDAGIILSPYRAYNFTVSRLASLKGETTCVIMADGALRCWGMALNGQGFQNPPSLYVLYPQISSIPGFGPGGQVVTSGTVGDYAACFNTSGGVFCFGNSGSEQACINSPVLAPPGHNVTTTMLSAPALASGDLHTCMVSGGTVSCCGPQDITGAVDGGPALQVLSAAPRSVGVGFRHGCVTTDQDTVWCFGQANHGKLGPGLPSPVAGYNPPVQVPLPFAATAEVYVGWEHNCAVSDTREQVACWGLNNHAQLGMDAGSTGSCSDCSDEPVSVSIPQQMQ